MLFDYCTFSERDCKLLKICQIPFKGVASGIRKMYAMLLVFALSFYVLQAEKAV
jgi:hypothetical protein